MRKIFIVSIFLMLVLTGCGNQVKEQLTDGEKFKEEYESLNNKENGNGNFYRTLEIAKENPFVYKTAEQIVEMMDAKKSFVVYFGFASCPWCRSVIPSLIDVANDLGIFEIYYVDVKEIRDVLVVDEFGDVITEREGTEGYYQLLEKLDNLLEEYMLTDENEKEVATGEKRIYAPNIVSVVEGVATEITDGISSKQTDGYMEITSEMKTESYDKIKCSIQCVVDSKKVCSTKTKC